MRTLAALFLLNTAFLLAQSAPAFEAASIKPSAAESGDSSGITTRIGSISAHNVTLRRCIRGAYGVQETQIIPGPAAGLKWIAEDRYDIEAKAAGPAGDNELMAMLKTLLAERFQLMFHRETKEMPGYALTVGKSGLLAKRSQPGAERNGNSSNRSIDCTACGMSALALKLGESIHFPVADVTGIDGAYDFHLKFVPMELQAKPSADDGPTVYEAVQGVGLKLEARKVPTEVFVVDRAVKPSEN